MKEEIDKWAKNKAKEWIFNLRKGLSEKRKILGYDGYHYILEKAFKTGGRHGTRAVLQSDSGCEKPAGLAVV